MRYAITHGIRNGGADPSHTPEGIKQIEALRPNNIARVVVGTGLRHIQILETLIRIGELTENTKSMISPFVGSADAYNPSEGGIVLPSRYQCPLEDYIGINNPRFDIWGFVSDQIEGTLFLCGAEFLSALGVGKPAKGALYAVDIDTRACTLLQQG
jgi:hypothetical protein